MVSGVSYTKHRRQHFSVRSAFALLPIVNVAQHNVTTSVVGITVAYYFINF